jgi:metal-responsive CopG/Arc/MetJ family transcriptional regulator
MLQQDYIMRLIREFMAALQRFLEKNEGENKQEALRDLYRQYLGEYELYHTTTMEEVMQSFERFPQEQRIHRMEMLAELYYAETEVKTGPMRQMLLERAMQMFVFIDRNSRTFSFDRQSKISRIQEILHRENLQSQRILPWEDR